MTHPLNDKRDAIEALRDKVDRLCSEARALLPGTGELAHLQVYTVGGLEQALETLGETLLAIDGEDA